MFSGYLVDVFRIGTCVYRETGRCLLGIRVVVLKSSGVLESQIGVYQVSSGVFSGIVWVFTGYIGGCFSEKSGWYWEIERKLLARIYYQQSKMFHVELS